ncbi:hypothetical protein Aperf_G00000095014 [Anoplocephala perfoliata]
MGLVSRKRIINATQALYICSFYSQPIQAAVRATLYKAEGIIPGGCGIGSTANFSSSTIETHWWNSNSDLQGKSAQPLEWWTSTIRFYSASPPQTDPQSCASQFNSNSSFFDNLVYRIYFIPLVTSGGSEDTYVNPSPMQVLRTLSRISSYGDAPLKGTLVASFKARDLKLFEDNSHEVQVARHLGTASVFNVIAEYKSDSLLHMESSTFVAYAPTVLYTCPHSARRSPGVVRNSSDQLSCDLLQNAPVITQISIGVIIVASALYALAGSFCVWFRCGIANFLTSSYLCLVIFYGHTSTSDNAGYLLTAGLLIPMIMSSVLMAVIYFFCIRHSLLPGTPPLAADIFNPARDSSTYGAFSLDNDWTQFNTHSYPVIPPPYPDASSSEVDTGQNSAWSQLVNCCCGCRQINQFRLWRLARLVSIFPAVLLLTSLFMQFLMGLLGIMRNTTFHVASFIVVYIALVGLMYKFKNLSFGISVALTGSYILLTSVALLSVKNSLLPYVLLDEFLVLTWPKERLRVFNIPAYGRNDIILLVVWLTGSLFIGLITLCTLRLSDSHRYQVALRRAKRGILGTTETEADYAGTFVGWIRQVCNRWRRSLGPFATSSNDETEPILERRVTPVLAFSGAYVSAPSPPPPIRRYDSIIQAPAAWPPAPMGPGPLFTGSSSPEGQLGKVPPSANITDGDVTSAQPRATCHVRAFSNDSDWKSLWQRRNDVFGSNSAAPAPPPPIVPMSGVEWREEVRARNRFPYEFTEGANPFGTDEDDTTVSPSSSRPAEGSEQQ